MVLWAVTPCSLNLHQLCLSEAPKFHKIPFWPPKTFNFPRRELQKLAGVMAGSRDYIALVTLRALTLTYALKVRALEVFVQRCNNYFTGGFNADPADPRIYI